MKRRGSLALVVIATGILLLSASAAWAAFDWVDHPTNPVVDPAHAAYYPDVHYDASQFSGHGTAAYFKMWYDAGPNIWLATSGDATTWAQFGAVPVLAGARHPQVWYDASSFGDSQGDFIQGSSGVTYTVDPYYKMWYWDGAGGVFFAYSSDGETWATNYAPEVIPSEKFPAWPTAPVYDLEVLYTGSGYMGWADNNGHIYNCSSSDGTTWSVGSEIVTPSAGEWDSVNHSRVSVVQMSPSEWHMWFGGTSSGAGGGNWGVGHATSSDGSTWVKDSPNVPIQSLGGFGAFGGLGQSGSWNGARNYAMSVIYSQTGFDGHGDGAQLKMMRSGKNTETAGNYSLGYASAVTSPTPTTLSATRSAVRINYGGVETISGELFDENGVEISGADKEVTLWRSNNYASPTPIYTKVATATYDAGSGTYKANATLISNTAFHLEFAGDGSYAASKSWNVLVLSKAYMYAPRVTSKVYDHRWFNMYSYFKPGQWGETRVELYRYQNGKWELWRWRYGKNTKQSRTQTRWDARLNLPNGGSWKARARHWDSGHDKTYSPWYYFKVY